MAFYKMDPWGDQRADLRAAQAIAVQIKSPPPLGEMVLFPDDQNEIPDDVTSDEGRWMLELSRNAGG